jgi:hypothetical protein
VQVAESAHTPVHPAPHDVEPDRLQQMYPSLAQSEVKLHPVEHEPCVPEMQTPLEQLYPLSHVVPLQHASSSEPHSVQMPLEHA